MTEAGNHLAEATPAPIDLPIAGVVDDFYAGNRRNTSQLWFLLAFEMWRETWS